jgi:transposase
MWWGANTEVYVYQKPCDMRKGFNMLMGIVEQEMQLNPLSGYLFVFINGNRTRLKILFWDRDGLVVICKRLEKGTFRRPIGKENGSKIQISQEDLYMILRGIDFENTKKRKRYLSNNFVN